MNTRLEICLIILEKFKILEIPKITIDGQIKGLEMETFKENQLFDTREF